MIDRELLQLTLNALIHHQAQTRPIANTQAVIFEMEAHLAQPEEKYQYGTPLLDAMTAGHETAQPVAQEPVERMNEWKLVPVEPTDAMALAACKVSLRNPAINGVHQYRAMLNAAPEAPAQEPVAWAIQEGLDRLARARNGYADSLLLTVHATKAHSYIVPLYTAPPQHKPLTDEEIDKALDSAGVPEYPGCKRIDHLIARAIEAAHGIGVDK